jgi:hypothetical protein
MGLVWIEAHVVVVIIVIVALLQHVVTGVTAVRVLSHLHSLGTSVALVRVRVQPTRSDSARSEPA